MDGADHERAPPPAQPLDHHRHADVLAEPVGCGRAHHGAPREREAGQLLGPDQAVVQDVAREDLRPDDQERDAERRDGEPERAPADEQVERCGHRPRRRRERAHYFGCAAWICLSRSSAFSWAAYFCHTGWTRARNAALSTWVIWIPAFCRMPRIAFMRSMNTARSCTVASRIAARIASWCFFGSPSKYDAFMITGRGSERKVICSQSVMYLITSNAFEAWTSTTSRCAPSTTPCFSPVYTSGNGIGVGFAPSARIVSISAGFSITRILSPFMSSGDRTARLVVSIALSPVLHQPRTRKPACASIRFASSAPTGPSAIAAMCFWPWIRNGICTML